MILFTKGACRLKLVEGHQHPTAQSYNGKVETGLTIQIAGNPLLEKARAEAHARRLLHGGATRLLPAQVQMGVPSSFVVTSQRTRTRPSGTERLPYFAAFVVSS